MPLMATTPDAQVRTADAPERSRGRARDDRSTTRTFLGSCGQPAGRSMGAASRTPPRLSRRHTGWRRWRRPRGRRGRGRRGRPRVQSERVHFETCQERPGLMATGARGKVRQAKVWGHHHRDSERSHLGRQGHPEKEETKGTPTLQRGAGQKRPATAEETDTSRSHSDETRVLPRGSLALEALRSRGASQRVPKTRNHSREGRVLGDAGGTARPRACAPRVTAEGALPSRRPQPSAPAPAPLQGRVAVSPRGLLSLSPNGTVRKVGVTDLRRASDGKPADDPF